MKRVIVACGGAVATSTYIAAKIKELCAQHGITVWIDQVKISELSSYASGADLIVTTGRIRRDYGVPLVTGTAFLSGIGEAETAAAILEILNNNDV